MLDFILKLSYTEQVLACTFNVHIYVHIHMRFMCRQCVMWLPEESTYAVTAQAQQVNCSNHSKSCDVCRWTDMMFYLFLVFIFFF